MLFTPTPKGRLEDSVDSTMNDFLRLTLAARPMTVLEELAGIHIGFLTSPIETLPAKPPKLIL